MKRMLGLFLALLSPCLANAQSLLRNISTEHCIGWPYQWIGCPHRTNFGSSRYSHPSTKRSLFLCLGTPQHPQLL